MVKIEFRGPRCGRRDAKSRVARGADGLANKLKDAVVVKEGGGGGWVGGGEMG